jgi:hypothetical protein
MELTAFALLVLMTGCSLDAVKENRTPIQTINYRRSVSSGFFIDASFKFTIHEYTIEIMLVISTFYHIRRTVWIRDHR